MFGKSSASWAASLSLIALLSQPPAQAQPSEYECTQISPSARIAPLGRFSNMRYTEEHAYGYDVILWQAGDCLVGLLQHSEGLIGDTPAGLIEAVEYESSTGAIAFAAKLTMGLQAVVENGATVYRPSRDGFTFSGTLDLRGGTLVGEMRHSLDGAAPDAEDVTLSASGAASELYPNAVDYGEWREQLAPILRARGPRW